MRYSEDRYIEFNKAMVDSAIVRVGITREKISTLVLGKNDNYVSASVNRGTMFEDDLKKLCNFLSLDYEKVKIQNVVRSAPQKQEKVEPTMNFEQIIAGMNALFQMQKQALELQKQQTGILNEILSSLKSNTAKQNNLENALGQLVTHTLTMKEHLVEVKAQNEYVKGQLNITNGKLRDIHGLFQKMR